jgi:hypothetical protein
MSRGSSQGGKPMIDQKLKMALFKTHGIELESGDTVDIRYNYADYAIVDVIVTDFYSGQQFTFYAYDTRKGTFPY